MYSKDIIVYACVTLKTVKILIHRVHVYKTQQPARGDAVLQAIIHLIHFSQSSISYCIMNVLKL